jgi:arylsulfatase A-like enzyme
MDWTATILAATGTKADNVYPLDGEDLMAVCRGTRAPFDRTLFWRNQTQSAARLGKWKYVHDSAEALFDLSIDPGEKNDLRSTHADVFDRLRSQYLAWDATVLPRRQRG